MKTFGAAREGTQIPLGGPLGTQEFPKKYYVAGRPPDHQKRQGMIVFSQIPRFPKIFYFAKNRDRNLWIYRNIRKLQMEWKYKRFWRGIPGPRPEDSEWNSRKPAGGAKRSVPSRVGWKSESRVEASHFFHFQS